MLDALSTSLPCMPMPPSQPSMQERVVEASFLHQRYAPADDEGGHAALVVATKHDLFNVGN